MGIGIKGNLILRNLADGRSDDSFHADVTPLFRSGAIAVQRTGNIVFVGWVRSLGRTISLGEVGGGACLTAAAQLRGDGSPDEGFGFAHNCRPEANASPG